MAPQFLTDQQCTAEDKTCATEKILSWKAENRSDGQKFSTFSGTLGTIACKQEPASRPYPEPVSFSRHHLEKVGSSETSSRSQNTTRSNNPEDSRLCAQSVSLKLRQ
jgi:hypothetical protein